MELRRTYEYIVQYKGNTGVESEDWFSFAWYAVDTDAFEAIGILSRSNKDREYRVVERTTIDTVLPY